MIEVKPSSAYRFTFFQTFSTDPHVVSTRMQPRCCRSASSSIVTPNAGRMTTSAGVSTVERFARVGEEADALRAQLGVDVRVVDDLAGQIDGAIAESAAAPGMRNRRRGPRRSRSRIRARDEW